MVYVSKCLHACSTQEPTIRKYFPGELKYKRMDNLAIGGRTVSGQSALDSARRGELNGIGFEESARL